MTDDLRPIQELIGWEPLIDPDGYIDEGYWCAGRNQTGTIREAVTVDDLAAWLDEHTTGWDLERLDPQSGAWGVYGGDGSSNRPYWHTANLDGAGAWSPTIREALIAAVRHIHGSPP